MNSETCAVLYFSLSKGNAFLHYTKYCMGIFSKYLWFKLNCWATMIASHLLWIISLASLLYPWETSIHFVSTSGVATAINKSNKYLTLSPFFFITKNTQCLNHRWTALLVSKATVWRLRLILVTNSTTATVIYLSSLCCKLWIPLIITCYLWMFFSPSRSNIPQVLINEIAMKYICHKLPVANATIIQWQKEMLWGKPWTTSVALFCFSPSMLFLW